MKSEVVELDQAVAATDDRLMELAELARKRMGEFTDELLSKIRINAERIVTKSRGSKQGD